jgi:glycosyltransferase involved in cell wall biosynthesis
MFVREKQSDEKSIVQFRPDPSLVGRLRRLWRYGRLRRDFFPRYVSYPGSTGNLTDDRTRFAGEVVSQIPVADIHHLHWVAAFIDLPAFFEKSDRPVVWTLHDMNPFTGGCHYSLGCRRFEQTCGRCPRLGSENEYDPSRNSWERKRASFQRTIQQDQLTVVAPSEWLANEARQSTLLGEASIYRIPHGLDHTLFRPRESSTKRKKLGLEQEELIVLFVADSVTNPLKGFDYMCNAFEEMEIRTETTLVSIGRHEPTIPSTVNHVHAGYVEDDQQLSALYSMADVSVIPSVQEAFGQTALESMSCGTPVVGFDAGGIPDMVRPGETGWLAETGDVRSLRDAIEAALSNEDERRRKAIRCREVVEEEYTIERQAKQYEALYESILENEEKSANA